MTTYAPIFFSEADKSNPKATEDQLGKLQALASLPASISIGEADQKELSALADAAVKASDTKKKLDEIAGIVKMANGNLGAGKAGLELRETDPAQAGLNLQLALTRLVSDQDEQELARLDGLAFQKLYNLTNDQMLTLCRLAVDLGVYEQTADLRAYMKAFGALDPVVKSLSPAAVQRLGVDPADDGLIGSCSCCCP